VLQVQVFLLKLISFNSFYEIPRASVLAACQAISNIHGPRDVFK